jgi:hypothetical protein
VRWFFFSSALVVVVAVAVGCATGGEQSSGLARVQNQPKHFPVTDYTSLIKSLRGLGAGAAAAGEVEQPFFSITGRMIKVHGADVQIFQYANAAAAAAEAAPISRDGLSVGTRKIFWVEPPHFFKKEKLLVLYVGTNAKVMKTLEAVLGPQFAGQ